MHRWLLPQNATTADELVLGSASVPDPGAGQVRIAVRGLSINARDKMILAGPFGRIPDTDLVPLSDVAGTIDAVGSNVDGWVAGDRVMTAHAPGWPGGTPVISGIGAGSLGDPGVAAEYIIAPVEALIPTPTHLTDEEASTLQVAGVTAWNSLFGARPIVAGEKVLIIGSGGVSLYAAQLARTAGAEVHAAVRGGEPEDAQWATLGFLSVTDTSEPGWGAKVAEASHGGVDKVVNILGPGAVPECLQALAPGGEVAVPGLMDMSSPEINITDMIGKQTTIRGVAVGSAQMHRDLAAFMEEHNLHPIIDRTMDFRDLPDAYAAMSAPGIFGKIVLTNP